MCHRDMTHFLSIDEVINFLRTKEIEFYVKGTK